MPACYRPVLRMVRRIPISLVLVLVLGLDTATPACGVAVADVVDGQVRELAAVQVVDARRHGELLAPLITRALREAGVSPGELGAIVVGLGPGPYTSLRVGIVTAVTLADALAIAAYGVCSLDGMASDSPGTVTVATDARRREVYFARYRSGERVAGPSVAVPATVAAGLEPDERVTGAGGALYAQVFGAAYDSSGPLHPSPIALIRRAGEGGLIGSAPTPLEPLYLRRPDATPQVAS
jgi:tRNA threonylcarbamoyl adenosine modification protein YeaZ